MKTRAVALALPLALAACTGGGAGEDDLEPAPGQEVRSQKARETAPEVPSGDQVALVAGGNDFAMRLHRELAASEGNLVYSPLSMSTALAMVYAGARGETETEMASALGYALPQDRLHPALNWLDLELSSRADPGPAAEGGTPVELNLVNRVWGQTGFSFLPTFLDTLATSYDTGLNLFDFATEADAARLSINKWVANQTNERIEELLKPGVLNSSTRLVLTNVVYLIASWQKPFAESDTRPASFQPLVGSAVTVPTMHKQDKGCAYAAGDGYVLAELPYVGRQVAMTFLLPDAGRFAEIEANLTGEKLEEMFAALSPAALEIALPRFKIELALDLPDSLRALGMTSLFGFGADLSGMTGIKDLFLASVVHKAFIDVNEVGTEAAAATAGVVEEVSEPEWTQVAMDRPFLFFLRDRVTGAVLFVGRVTNPKS